MKEFQELSVAEFKDLVEVGLRNHFGRDGRNADLAGQLSVHPDRVGSDVTSEELEFRCEDFSTEFQRTGKLVGIRTELAVSNEGNFEHMYLTPAARHGLPDVIVDLTVGQYVRGHNHAFVGTREELREIVVHQTGSDRPFELVEPSDAIKPEEFELYKEPPKFFRRKWGDASTII